MAEPMPAWTESEAVAEVERLLGLRPEPPSTVVAADPIALSVHDHHACPACAVMALYNAQRGVL